MALNDPPLALVDEHARPGIVFAFRFPPSGPPVTLGPREMPRQDPTAPGFWWIHVNLVDKRGREWIAALPDLPDEAKEVLLSNEQNDRIDSEGGVLAGAFVDLRLDFGGASEDIAQLRFALGPNLLVTGRRHSLRSIEATRASIDAGQRAESALDLLETIVDHEADGVARAAVELGHAVDRVEDLILAGETAEAREGIGQSRRRAVRLHRQLARLLVLFRRVELAPAMRLPADVREAAGRIAQRLESIHQEVHASQERARLLQDEASARLAAETNRQLYVLSMITAVFLPATLISGLFGMNTKGLPFTDDDNGFWLACGVAALAAAAVYLGLMVALRRR